jgi:cob(I)alamin adenosyltransferase
MAIYSRNGDLGATSLFDGTRVYKDDPSIEVCGNLDELSASLGMLRTENLTTNAKTIILRIQQELILFCSDVVSDSTTISPEYVKQIELEIDQIESQLTPITKFVIPGENRCSAMLHLCRTVCRRAERSLVTLNRTRNVSPHLMAYLNRLGDLLFTLASLAAALER